MTEQTGLRGLLRRVSFRRKMLYAWLGVDMPLKSPVRAVLEQTILPYYAGREDIEKILFIGCDSYTKHYWKLFRGKEYWTIEPDPERKVFGAKKHVIDKLENLHLHFSPGYFDLIISNGVYGWGLNSKAQCEVGFQNCYDCLRERGEFILGWNDVPKYRPLPLEKIESLAQFRPQPFPPLSTWRYRMDTGHRHTFDFYIKPIE